jgi:hypothetical protein
LIIDPSSQQEFSDADFRFVDNGDQSKKLAFEVSGIATGTTRTITVPNSDMSFSSAFATFLNTPSSANFAALLTDETGTAGTVPFHSTGSWTPADVSGAGLSLTVADATWTRIGRVIFAPFRFTMPATASGTNAQFGGLPFTSRTTTGGVALSSGSVGSDAGTPNGVLSPFLLSAATSFVVLNANGVSATNANLSGRVVSGTIIYHV